MAIASLSKYNLLGVFLVAIFPIVIFAVLRIPLGQFLLRVRYVLPVICAVGICNPFFDKSIWASFEWNGMVISISGGLVSMLTLMLKGLLCLMASFLLIATTSMDQICLALRSIRFPNVMTSLIMLTYRYIHLLIYEVHIMSEAYALRAPGQKGIAFSAWGSFLGNLLLRSMDRAEQIFFSMELRGFDGEFHYVSCEKMRRADYCIIASLGLLVLVGFVVGF